MSPLWGTLYLIRASKQVPESVQALLVQQEFPKTKGSCRKNERVGKRENERVCEKKREGVKEMGTCSINL